MTLETEALLQAKPPATAKPALTCLFAFCAQVWNPSFDVTPANLLTGIITEHGVIQRSGQTFAVAEFLRAEVHR